VGVHGADAQIERLARGRIVGSAGAFGRRREGGHGRVCLDWKNLVVDKYCCGSGKRNV